MQNTYTVIKVSTASFMWERNNFSFWNVEFHVVFATPLSHKITTSLQKLTILDRLYVSTYVRIMGKYEKCGMLDYNMKITNKYTEYRRSR
jgi:hypothetical protein